MISAASTPAGFSVSSLLMIPPALIGLVCRRGRCRRRPLVVADARLLTPSANPRRVRRASPTSSIRSTQSSGLGSLARAAHLGEFFHTGCRRRARAGQPADSRTRNADGNGQPAAAPHRRLRARADDVNVDLKDPDARGPDAYGSDPAAQRASGEESLDAREFAAEARPGRSALAVSRVIAVDTLR